MRHLMMTLWMATAMVACDQDPDGLVAPTTDVGDDFDGEQVGPLADRTVGQASTGAPQITVVAWSAGPDIRQSAYCTDFNPTTGNRCACVGLDGEGWLGQDDDGNDIKCKMCRDTDGWPCALEPNSGTEVELTFVGGPHAMYFYVDDDIVTPVTSPWMLSCDEPPASCPHTCDPGVELCTCAEDRLEFAAVRRTWDDGDHHVTATGGLVIDLGDTCD
ncbi:MAG: hypothetical protein K0V04_10310 [Deltaproteobacteria bacterium]|nr:hypothetical protein [Deltaproteobacteria bacterium]